MTKKHVVVTKGPLFGYEGDLELTRYAITEGTVKKVLNRGEGQYVALCSHRDTALSEAEAWASELRLQRGRNRSKPVRVYAIRQQVHTEAIVAAELIATAENFGTELQAGEPSAGGRTRLSRKKRGTTNAQ